MTTMLDLGGVLCEMAPLENSLRLDCRAELLLKPRSAAEAAAVLADPLCKGEVPRVIGGGTNLVLSRTLVPGVVLSVTALRQTRFDGRWVTAGAGTPLPRLIAETVARGLAGLERLAGIPGTLGGALAGNSGGKYGETGDFVESVRLVNRQGQIEERRDLPFRYRDSGLKGSVVLEATLALEAARDPVALRQRYREIMAEKAERQPLASSSAGCVFKNPSPEMAAARLIDRAGWKGKRVGAAMVSTVHANFIVNEGGATGAEVLELIGRIEEDVLERFGVRLEREVELW